MQLPSDFCQMMTSIMGETEFARLADAIAQPSPTSIRLNIAKTNTNQLSDMLADATPVSWCAGGYYLPERPQFTFDPLMHAGCYYVQEAASMYVGKLLKEHFTTHRPIVALDACAAPGGKSTLALDSLPAGSLLVANEYVRQRSHILVENLMKWGNPNIIVTNSDTACFTSLRNMFDVIICDAPCSGEGMFRKDPKSIDEWSLDNVHTCVERQREIVSNLWTSLRPGGLFIYSTCTYNNLEDEDNVQWIQHQFGTALLSEQHFYPHEHKGEGFFVAALRKNDDDYEDENVVPKKKKKTGGKQSPLPKVPAEVKKWLNDQSLTLQTSPDGTFFAFPSPHLPVLEAVTMTSNVISRGIAVAEMKGKNVQPCHNLALSSAINKDAFPMAEVDYTTAIAYLRGEAVTLPSATPLGFVIVTYHNHPLGFVKNIGNRANNLYPTEWRIRTTHVPTKRNN